WVVVPQAVSASEVEKHDGVGRVEPSGALQQVDCLLIILSPPGVGGLLKQTSERAYRSQALAFHDRDRKMKDRLRSCKRSFSRGQAGNVRPGDSREYNANVRARQFRPGNPSKAMPASKVRGPG